MLYIISMDFNRKYLQLKIIFLQKLENIRYLSLFSNKYLNYFNSFKFNYLLQSLNFL